jgi:hypothetical protein
VAACPWLTKGANLAGATSKNQPWPWPGSATNSIPTASRFTPSPVEQVFLENDPVGTTNLAAVLQDALNNFFQRRAAGDTAQAGEKGGETILVITDGEPDDRRAVIDVIINATQKLDRDEELAISFIQVGNDAGATAFLKALDDQLEGVGAKFDICDTMTIDDMGDMSLAEVLLAAIED